MEVALKKEMGEDVTVTHRCGLPFTVVSAVDGKKGKRECLPGYFNNCRKSSYEVTCDARSPLTICTACACLSAALFIHESQTAAGASPAPPPPRRPRRTPPPSALTEELPSLRAWTAN